MKFSPAYRRSLHIAGCEVPTLHSFDIHVFWNILYTHKHNYIHVFMHTAVRPVYSYSVSDSHTYIQMHTYAYVPAIICSAHSEFNQLIS